MADSVTSTGFSREQKIGFIFMLVFAILTVSLGALQLRNTIYGPFVIKPAQTAPLEAIASNDEARLKSIDTDHDNLNDYEELYLYETSPYLPDTDSDGMNDKVEIDRGSDPLCPEGTKCNVGEAAPPATASSSVASPLFKESLGAAEILSAAPPTTPTNSATNNVDIQKLIADPVQLRALILSTGKIDQAALNKIDDVTLQKMAFDLLINTKAETAVSVTTTP